MLLVEKHVASFITAGVYIFFSISKILNLPMCHQIVFKCFVRIIYFTKMQRLLAANLYIYESFLTKYEKVFVLFLNESISHPCCEQEYNVTYVSRRTSHFALNFKIMHLIQRKEVRNIRPQFASGREKKRKEWIKDREEMIAGYQIYVAQRKVKGKTGKSMEKDKVRYSKNANI